MPHDLSRTLAPQERAAAPSLAPPLAPALAPVAQRAAALNARYRHHGATALLERALQDADLGRIALVSSFGADSVVLLHMLSVLRPETPVLFLQTELLFAETLAYQRALTDRLGLVDVRLIHPDAQDRARTDPDNRLHQRDPDACCRLRKAEPLERALGGFDAWITGRKRFQGGSRAALEFFETESDARIKVNPLARWSREDVQDYMRHNRLPRHPLVAQGFPSIGCAPCTSPVAAGEDERAGRWRGSDKAECGIHLVDGRIARGPRPASGPQTGLPPGPPATAALAAADPPAGSSLPEPAPGAAAFVPVPRQPVIVTDAGFGPDDWDAPVTPLADLPARPGPLTAVSLGPTDDPAALLAHLPELAMIRVGFAGFADGRGFSQARQLRRMGYRGRLRAAGPLIADQYAMARRSGFDEVEIPEALARRQPWEHWQARADWRAHDYQSRLRA